MKTLEEWNHYRNSR